MLDRIKSWFGWGSSDDQQFARQRAELIDKIPVPVFWLFGKTGSGKTSIVRYLTGSTQAEIGNGFQPQTRTSFQYDFPTSEQPIVRFLDTRGLGEAGYDPAEDLAAFDKSTHVVIVVVRLMDHALDEVVNSLRKVRAARSSRPILLALTCLHEAYPFEQHPDPDPFEVSPAGLGDGPRDASQNTTPESDSDKASATVATSSLARFPELQRSLREQEIRFEGLVDRIVPIDLTRSEEGFYVPDFGGRRFETALMELLPAACREALFHLDVVRNSLRDLAEEQALPAILQYSSLAAGAAAAPLPWIDIPIVMGLQTRLVYVLADQYDQKMNLDVLLKMAGAVAGRLALRFAVKAPLKFVPVLGQTANAAMAFAYTFSLGKACCWYFGEMKGGHVPTSEELNRVWAEQLKKAVGVWRERAKL